MSRNANDDIADLISGGIPVPVAAHAASHQNGGSDEINVGGLSGVLADPQPPIIGATATTAVAGNDARLTNARPPTPHAASHLSAGADAIKLDDLAAPDDNTDLDSSASRHGLLPKLSGAADKVLRGDGTWGAAPLSTGIPGRDGRDGDMGVPGPRGSSGATGAPGTPGTAGSNGATIPAVDGRQGEWGPPGARGPAGTPGSTGPAGAAGVGIPGRDGAPGESGPPGQRGATGPSGAPGTPGTAGSNGATIPAVDGRQGEWGPPGARGATGPAGTPGTSGRAGVTIPAFDGQPGPMGPPGPRGATGPAGSGSSGDFFLQKIVPTWPVTITAGYATYIVSGLDVPLSQTLTIEADAIMEIG